MPSPPVGRLSAFPLNRAFVAIGLAACWGAALPCPAAAAPDTPEAWRTPEPVISPVSEVGGASGVKITVPVIVTDSQTAMRVHIKHLTGETRVEILPAEGRPSSGADPMPIRPSPRPVPAEPQGQLPARDERTGNRLAIGVWPMLHAERYISGGLDVTAGLVTAGALDFNLDFGGGFLQGRLAALTYAINDVQADDSRHDRQEGEGELLGGLHARSGNFHLRLGAGWWARQLGVTNNYPLGLTSPLVTSATQLFHGPRLGGRVEVPLVADIGAELAVTLSPYVFAVGDTAVAELAPLYGYAVSPALTWRPTRDIAAQLTYRLNWLQGFSAPFAVVRHGPSLSMGWRF